MSVTMVIAIIGICLTLLVQFAGVIWFAATQRQIVSSQERTVHELSKAVNSLESIASSLDKRVTVLEDRAARQA